MTQIASFGMTTRKNKSYSIKCHLLKKNFFFGTLGFELRALARWVLLLIEQLRQPPKEYFLNYVFF
jgi:hypothetical protein